MYLFCFCLLYFPILVFLINYVSISYNKQSIIQFLWSITILYQYFLFVGTFLLWTHRSVSWVYIFRRFDCNTIWTLSFVIFDFRACLKESSPGKMNSRSMDGRCNRTSQINVSEILHFWLSLALKLLCCRLGNVLGIFWLHSFWMQDCKSFRFV